MMLTRHGVANIRDDVFGQILSVVAKVPRMANNGLDPYLVVRIVCRTFLPMIFLLYSVGLRS